MIKSLLLGNSGPKVFPLGLGCMGMSDMYGGADEAESLRTLHAAMEVGSLLVDTGDFYGMGHNEMLIAKAIEGKRDRVFLSVKFGAMRGPNGQWIGFDSRPSAIKNFIAYSLKRLRTDVIDIYRPSRLDPQVPIEDTIGTIADLVQAGYVRHVGLSEVGAETIRRAHKVHPICDLQIEYAVATRKPEKKIFPVLAELGISATLYGIYSRGLLTGSRPAPTGDYRKHLPRFVGEQAAHNARAVQALHEFANTRLMSPAQVLVAWVRAKQPGLLPLVGARTISQWTQALSALDVSLSPADVLALEGLFPAEAIVGDRYAPEQMRSLDSER